MKSQEKKQFQKLKQRWASEKQARKELSETYKKILIEKGSPVFQRFGVRKVVLFGSVPDERCSENSDLDILVSPLSNLQYWKFRHELEEAIGLPVDLYTDGDDPVFVKKILARGEVLYEV